MTIVRLLDNAWPERKWRRVTIGDLVLAVPEGWSEPEAIGDGGYVLHNRLRRHRIDGDAVWYASAIELHVRSSQAVPLPPSVTMNEHRRIVSGATGSYEVCLRVACGVGREIEQSAKRVLSSARIESTGRSAIEGKRRNA